MKKLFLLAMLSAGSLAQANPVSVQQALRNAQAFVGKHSPTAVLSAQTMNVSKKIKGTQPAFYVFNIDKEGGYVIASGSDKVRPILGYVDNGSFDENNIPPAMQFYLDLYADQIEWAEKNDILAAPAHTMAKTDVPMMLTTKWDQTSPYNTYFNYSGQYIWWATGCLTTATAQVMNYHKWPPRPTETIPSFNTTSSTTVPALEPIDFEWDLMKDTYASNRDTTDASVVAVARLMQYIASAEEASMGLSTSTANKNAAYALKKYFDYDDGVRFVQDWDVTPVEWDSLIYTELINNRPVIHCGSRFSSAEYGHAFVIDGYRADDGLYHVNWGWGGSSDGYFALDALEPSSIGTGGGSGTGGYNYLRGITLGVQKPDGIEADEKSEVLDQLTMMLLSDKEMYRDSRDQDFGDVRVGVLMFPVDRQPEPIYDLSLGLYNEAGDLLRTYPIQTTNFGTYKNSTWFYHVTMPIGAELPLGKYELKTVSRLVDTDEYQSSPGANHRRMRLEVAENKLTVTPAYDLTVSNVELENLSTYSSNYKINFDLTNNSDEDFVGRLYFVVDASTLMFSYNVYVPAGETVHFSPNRTYTKSLSSSSNIAIAFDSRRRFSIWNSLDTWANVDYHFVANHKADADGNLAGNTVDFTVRISNRGEVQYNKDITAILYETGTSYLNGETVVVPATVEPKNNAQFNFQFPNLEEGKSYSLRVTHFEGKANTSVTYGPFIAGKGTVIKTGEYVNFDKAGNSNVFTTANETVVKDGDAVAVPDDALYVDARLSATPEQIVPGNNPNTVYLLAEGTTVPEALKGKNVVVGNTAEVINIIDGKPFETPVDITAATVNYVRTFAGNGDGVNGWESIALPFEVNNVMTSDGTPAPFFADAADQSGKIWLMSITEADENQVTIDYANMMNANESYLIAVKDLAGQELVFTGANVTLGADAKSVSSIGDFDFIGRAGNYSTNYMYVLSEPAYAKTEDGTSAEVSSDVFTLVNNQLGFAVEPFRAYLVNYNQGVNNGTLAINIATQTATGITDVTVADVKASTGIFTIDGRRISGTVEQLPAGIYIINGKKVVR